MAAPLTDPFALTGKLFANRFVVDAPIAEGGFGVVYRAQQQALGRTVALKLLKPSDELPQRTRMELLDSFRREARIIAELSHPAIVQVLDFGIDEAPRGGAVPWMALEWLDGETLDDWLDARKGRPTSPGDALELLRPAIEAVHEAHLRGVAHRDIKPANIMRVRGVAGATRVKVLDFGIARLMQPDDEPGTGETATRSAFTPYSPRHAAPEQIGRGRTGPWTDVHALALILSEALTGTAAYAANDRTSLSLAAFAPDRPTPARVGVDVGPWEPILARALALRPADRYPDAGALLDALSSTVREATLAGSPQGRTDPDPAPSAPPPPAARASSPPRPRVVPMLLVGAAIALSVGVALAMRSRPSHPRAAALATPPAAALVPERAVAPLVPAAPPITAPPIVDPPTPPPPSPARVQPTSRPTRVHRPERVSPRPEAAPPALSPPAPSHTTAPAHPNPHEHVPAE